jgi:hypothetical protein
MRNTTNTPYIAGLAALCCSVLGVTSAMAAGYTVKDLGPGYPWDLNSKGQLVSSQNSGPVQWNSDGTAQPLSDLTAALLINDKGSVAGAAVTGGTDPRYPVQRLYFRDASGTNTLITGLSPVADVYTALIAIDGTDRVLADSSYASPFFWSPQNPTITALHTLNNAIYELNLTGMNASGMVVGTGSKKALNSLGYTRVSFVGSTPAKGTDLGVITPIKTLTFTPSAINAVNQVVGSKESPKTLFSSASAKAYLWSMATGERLLPNLPGFKFTYPKKINAKGEVIGMTLKSDPATTPQDQVPYYWSAKTGAVDITTLLGSAKASVNGLVARAINDAGQIAAAAMINGEWHALLLTPTP